MIDKIPGRIAYVSACPCTELQIPSLFYLLKLFLLWNGECTRSREDIMLGCLSIHIIFFKTWLLDSCFIWLYCFHRWDLMLYSLPRTGEGLFEKIISFVFLFSYVLVFISRKIVFRYFSYFSLLHIHSHKTYMKCCTLAGRKKYSRVLIISI